MIGARIRSAIARWRGGRQAGKRAFHAARIDRLTAGWMAEAKSINEELRGDLDRLRARARDLVHNNDYASRFRGMVENNLIGPCGIQLQARVEDAPGKPDILANAAIEAAWSEWCGQCDVTGRQTFRDLCQTLVGGLPSDGEFLVAIVRGQDAGNRFGIALQAIDVDRIDTSFNQLLADGGRVIMGIELDRIGRTRAVHLFERHPHDGAASSRQRIRLPAGDFIHGYRVTRPGQVRGIPWMAPGMLSLHHLGGFQLAALLAAEHGANHFGFFTSPDGAPPPGIAADDGGEAISTTVPGVYDTLPAGYTFQPYDSRYPNEVFAPFVKSTLQRIASGWRIAYHSLGNDLEGVSFSSIRSGALEERDRWADDQRWFIAAFCEPVYRQWLTMALLGGAITMPNGSALPVAKAQKFSAHQWQPRAWDWVDPRADIEAKIMAVRAGAMAPQDIAAATGQDYEDVIARIAQAQRIAQTAGVSLSAYEAAVGARDGATAEAVHK